MVLLNDPVPLVAQLTPVALVALAPVILKPPEFEQVDWLPPALGTGAAMMVNILDDVAEAQGALPEAVKVKVTLPAVISPVLGV